MERKSLPGVLSVPSSVDGAANGTPKTSRISDRFRVYDLVEDAPPKTFREAAERGETTFMVKLIERTIDFDINQQCLQDRVGRTALHWAAECNQVEAAKTLLDYGADVRAQECMGRSAVHLAARAADAEMLSTLLDALPGEQRSELVNAADKSGITPVFLAYQRGDEGQSCFEYLMAHGARYNPQQLDEQAAASKFG